MDPPEHTRLRRVLMGAFTTRRIQALRPRVEAIVGELLDAMEAQGPPVDLMPALAMPMPVTVTCELLGVPYEDRDQFRTWADLILSTERPDVTPEQVFQAFSELSGYLLQALFARRELPQDDLLTVLVEAREIEGKLTEREMINLASAVLVAGQETTVNQIGSFAYVLLTTPGVRERLREAPALWPNAIEELLRVAPVTATAGFARVATEDVEVGGTLVREGETVMPTLFSANVDERVFPDPQRIDLERDNLHAHLAFSHGPHHCPGAQLARMELQVALSALLERFPGLKLAGSAGDVPWKKSALSRGPEELMVTW